MLQALPERLTPTHDPPIIISRTYFAQHKLPPRLHPCQYWDAPPHHHLHRLPRKLDRFLRYTWYTGLVEHRDLSTGVVFLDIRTNVGVVAAAAAHEDLGDFQVLGRVAAVVVHDCLGRDARHSRYDIVLAHASFSLFWFSL